MRAVRRGWIGRLIVGGVLLAAIGAAGATAARKPLSNPGQVRLWYREYLHKEPDDRIVAKWSFLFRMGRTKQQVLHDILTTEGYYRSRETKHGNLAGNGRRGSVVRPVGNCGKR